MITVAVGTFIHGFDELVDAADQAANRLDLEGFAQIGHSAIKPQHLAFERFLDHQALMDKLASSDVLICHAGMGLIGDGLRAGCRIVVYPRRGATTKDNPANDQTAFAKAVCNRLGLGLCLDAEELLASLSQQLGRPGERQNLPQSNVPYLIAAHLAATAKA